MGDAAFHVPGRLWQSLRKLEEWCCGLYERLMDKHQLRLTFWPQEFTQAIWLGSPGNSVFPLLS